MSRLKADCLLLIAALIWGVAFVAQKSAMDEVGPFTFTGVRFALSVIVILPFLLKENKSCKAAMNIVDRRWIIMLGCTFFAGVVVQQIGMITTTVTNAGFLTSLYVVLTPLVSLFLFKIRPNNIVWLAAPLCVAGVWMLGNGSLTTLNKGDFMAISSAFFFALHIVMVGFILARFPKPFMIIACQYSICAALSLLCALATEHIDPAALFAIMPQIIYAGAVSGGIAYTLQVVAQQYTPASDAAVILSGEALFASIAGIIVMGDRLTPLAWTGCGVIFAAILLVEMFPLWGNRKAFKPR